MHVLVLHCVARTQHSELMFNYNAITGTHEGQQNRLGP